MIIIGDAKKELSKLDSKSVNCCVTSPPYFGLRDYGIPQTEWPEIEFSPMTGLPTIIIPAENCCLGLEKIPNSYIGHCIYILREVSRILKNDGTLWLNLGDTYGTGTRADRRPGNKSLGESTAKAQGIKRVGGMAKQLFGIPWRVAFALQADGWYLRQDIIWSKPNPMPESVQDRCTKAHEYIFLLSKSEKYYYDFEAIKEPVQSNKGNANSFRGGCYVNGNIDNATMGKRTVSGNSKAYSFKRKTATEGKPGSPKQHREDREDIEYSGVRNKRSVWTIATKPYKGAHFATFPPDLIRPCILAGCPEGGIVLDTFFGSGTVGEVSIKNNRDYIGIELNPKYRPLIDKRLERSHYQSSF